MNRRELLSSVVLGPALLAGLPPDGGALLPPPPGARSVKPLPFKPGALKGLSEKLLVSHHDNNYAGAVRNLAKVEEQLASLPADAPGYLVSGLRERALQFHNSMRLHEAYFENLGGDGKRTGALATALGPGWESSFRATALSLAGGSGWALLMLELSTGDVLTSWSGQHTQALAGAVPLLVLDMYEHSYALDYGASAAKYVDAFFQNLKWDEVERRYTAALAASRAWRGSS
ncbi:MAG: Fe-Mn family superoxide dismutase [Myxococcota bacterium]